MRFPILTTLLVASLAGLAAEEAAIAIADLPAAASAAVTTAVPGATIKKAEREEKDGKVIFEVECTTAAGKVDLTLTADGTVLEKESAIAVADLPEAVKAAIAKAVSGGEIEKAERCDRQGAITFEVEVETKQGDVELVLGADGAVLKRKEESEDKKGHEDDDQDAGKGKHHHEHDDKNKQGPQGTN